MIGKFLEFSKTLKNRKKISGVGWAGEGFGRLAGNPFYNVHGSTGSMRIRNLVSNIKMIKLVLNK